MEGFSRPRFPKAALGVFTINFCHVQNPFVIMWWSAAIPGFGHMILGKFMQGIILILWELYTNQQAHLNQSIYYSMVGDFAHARDTIETDWLLLYVAVYVFTIWDSYLRTIILNRAYYLSEEVDTPMEKTRLTTFGIHVLSRYSPRVATLCSFFLPGLGQIYLQRLVTGIFILVIWVLACVESHLLTGIHHTCVGNFHMSGSVLDPQWLLFLPSLYGFGMFDAYKTAYSLNELSTQELRGYLRQKYGTGKGDFMEKLAERGVGYCAASFPANLDLEMTLEEMERSGIKRDAMLILPLGEPRSKVKLFEGYMYMEDLLMNWMFAIGTIGMLLGVIYGFILPLGPVLWGLFGLLSGALVGLGIGYVGRRKGMTSRNRQLEVVVIVQGREDEVELAERIMRRHAPSRVYQP